MNKTFTFIVTALMCTTVMRVSALERDTSGFYLINNIDDLWEFTMIARNGQTTSNAKLTTDIDMEGLTNWMPIGWHNHETNYAYKGIFDGQGHVIRNFTLTPDADQDFEVGFFGQINGATIKNLGFENAHVSSASGMNVGVLAASLRNAKIENCYVIGDLLIETENTQQGAMAGFIEQSTTFLSCYTTYLTLGTTPDEGMPKLVRTFYGEEVEPIAATGELCFTLNGDQSTILFRQTLGQDKYPVFGDEHQQVYATGDFKCDGTVLGTATYSNTSGSNPIPPHEYDDDGRCVNCGTTDGKIEISQDGYFHITTPEELRYVSRSVVNAGNSRVKIRLMNDLDMSNIWNFPSIGIFDWPSGPQVAFQGEFDGQGHIIYNLTIDNTSDAQETGLFGRVNGGGYIHDFGVVNAKITANARAGVVAGEIHDCTVDNVFTAGDLQVISNNTAQHGGLSGEGANSTFNNCYTTFNGPLTNIPERLNNCYWGQDAIEKALTGELCYRLNGNDYRKPVWFQSIDQDEYPILDSSHGIVYPIRDGEFASATSLAEKAKMVNTLIDIEIENYEKIVCTQSLVENYIKKLKALKNTPLNDYITAYDGMTGLRAAINESAQAYAAYSTQAESALATILTGGFEGDEVDLLLDYLQSETEPNDNFENGSYLYIMNNLQLFSDEIVDETTSLSEMLETAISKGYNAGSDITMKLRNADFSNGLDGWETQGSMAASGHEGDIYAIALNAKLSVSQSITDLKPGLYEYQVGAYTDINGWSIAGQYNYADGFVRAGDMVNHVKSQGSDLIPKDVYNDMTNYEKNHFSAIENNIGTILGYKPITVEGVAIGFRKGFWNNRIVVKVEDELKVGQDFGGPDGRWNIMFFGDAHLRYLGDIDSEYSSEALDQTLAEMTAIANHIINDYVADYYTADATDAPNYDHALAKELKNAIETVTITSTNEAKYALIGTFGDIFQRIWESKEIYTKLAQINESVVNCVEEMMTEENLDEYYAYLDNVYYPILEIFETGDATNEEVLSKINELKQNEIYKMQEGIEPELGEDGFYQIADAYNLLWLSRQTNRGNHALKAALVSDIDLSVFNVFPSLSLWRQGGINGEAVESNMFNGVIDGQGHVIKNMKIEQLMGYEAGFISRAQGGTVRNLGFENPSVENSYSTWTGVLAGEFFIGTIENCWVQGNIEMNSDPEKTGGLCGECAGSIVSNSWTNHELLTRAGDIRNCYAGTDVEALKSSGELCYKLNGDQQNIVWRQNIGEDEYPVQDVTHAQVYLEGEKDCGGNAIGTVNYTNEPQETTLPPHQYDDSGICIICGDDLGKTTIDADGYMVISNPWQLRYFATYVNNGNYKAKARLTEDIDMSIIENFPMLGYYHWDKQGSATQFEGEIDGQGHAIKNLSITVNERVEAGFCSRAGGATFRNLGFENATITNTHSNGVRAGVLGGELFICNVINCWSCGDIQINTPHIQKGGLAGEAAGTNFSSCWTTYNTIGQMANSEVNTYSGSQVASMHLSGELCYKLNGGKVAAPAWRQNLGEDQYPVLNIEHKVVFWGEDGLYTNGDINLPNQKGTINDPFIVNNVYDLMTLNMYLNEKQMNCVKLAADLDMSQINEWMPLCNEKTYMIDFDGQGHVIRNLNCNAAGSGNSFFGTLCGNLRNIGFEDMIVSDGGSTGMIADQVGYEDKSEIAYIDHVFVKGQLMSAGTYGGGMFGKVIGPTSIKNSYTNVNINSTSTYTGGIVGQVSDQLLMKNVYAAGSSTKGGGIIGGGQEKDAPASEYVNIAVWNNDFGIFGHANRRDKKQDIIFYDSTNFGEMQAAVVAWDSSVWFCDMEEGSYPILIDLADMPDGIKEPISIPSIYKKEGVYDLYGRRISGKPANGIYIIDGKKVLVK